MRLLQCSAGLAGNCPQCRCCLGRAAGSLAAGRLFSELCSLLRRVSFFFQLPNTAFWLQGRKRHVFTFLEATLESAMLGIPRENWFLIILNFWDSLRGGGKEEIIRERECAVIFSLAPEGTFMNLKLRLSWCNRNLTHFSLSEEPVP